MPRLPDQLSDEILELLLCDGLGPASLGRMLSLCGSAEAARRAPASRWRQVLAPGQSAAQVIQSLDATDASEERRRMCQAGLRAVVLGDADYPSTLVQIPVPPIALWMRGSMSALGSVPVAVVGARRSTSYGMAQAGRFAGHLAAEGVAIVSGGARGVDAEAHRAAMRAGGQTVAVLGCGLAATPYPPEHGGLYECIVESGGLLLSEFPSHWPVLPANFPRRNRIIAGLSVAVVVIEATLASGALITARHAHDDQGRPVFALPGPVDSSRSEGCNRAIRDNLATLTLDPAEVVDELKSMGVLLAAGARMAAEQSERQSMTGLPCVIQNALPAVRQLLRKEPTADCTRVAEVTGLDARFAQVALTLHQLEAPHQK